MADAAKLIAIAVVESRGRFLVGVRPAGIALSGFSEFPGGKVEPGEVPAAAAIRECLEETGLAVEVVGEFPPHEHAYDHDRVRLLFFHCRPRDLAARPELPFAWVAREELATLNFPAGNHALLKLLQVPAQG